MCGYIGFYQKRDNKKEVMEKMLSAIEHRGPEDGSVYESKDFILGHRRLAIIDLETGNQPIFNKDKSLCIVFNGEIYNFPELKLELQNKGVEFVTTSDTELVLKGYEFWGKDILAKLNGIFSFAILHINENKLLLARDHFGIKPLHYYYQNGLLIFGSEQKSFLFHPDYERKLNYTALHSHLNLRYTQGNYTLFEGIKRLPPASYLEFDRKEIKIDKYWNYKPEINYQINENEAVEGINHYLKQAVKRQLLSDVPVGVYLSGGMDSSAIVQKMYELGVNDIQTFTLGFNEPTDEFSDAEIVAKHFNTNHRTFSLSMEPLKKLPQVIWHSEEPKINLLQGFNMSAFVKKHVKVVLGGLGGDELFAGYDIHKFVNPVKSYSGLIPSGMHKLLNWKSSLLFKLQNASGTLKYDEYRRGMQMLLALGDIERYYLILRNVWDYDKVAFKNIYHPSILEKMKTEIPRVKEEFDNLFNAVNDMNSLDQVLYTEFNSKMLNDYLLVEDRMSMANSVEERVPFLDVDLVNFVSSIPVEMKMKNNQTKYLFRKSMEGKLPERILNKKKWGFTINPYLQFNKDLKKFSERVLTKQFIDEQGIFNYDYINKIINYPPSPKLRWHYNYLFVVLGYAVWEKLFINDLQSDNKNKEIEYLFG